MFDEPEQPDKRSADRAATPGARAQEKVDEIRVHAELFAVFEGCRKFDAELRPKLKPEIARDCQKAIGRLEKSRMKETPVVEPEFADEARRVLDLPATAKLSTNDYHIHRRPGEVMIVRWLAGEQVESFYSRLQAHFDVALKQHREEERESHGWKQEPETLGYLDALDKAEVKMAEKYLRPLIAEHRFFALSTHTADEMDILHLCDFVMGIPSAEVVGKANAPGDAPTEQERAWFFKLFSLRGIVENEERDCFFTYLQRAGGEEF